MTKEAKRGLGRGLNALFDDEEASYTAPTAAVVEKIAEKKDPLADLQPNTGGPARSNMMIDKLFPGTFQPRYDFDDEALKQLSESIKQHGVLQPILVRIDPKGTGRYEIIAGERRWRASQLAQLHEVPVIIHSFSDEEALQVALVENLQRADLNPIEEALGYSRLMKEFDYSQDELGEILGKSRSHVANTMRLLNLPEGVQNYVREGKLSSGHARALVTAKDAKGLAQQVIAQGLSVRQTEKLAAETAGRETKGSAGGAKVLNGKPVFQKDADTLALEKDLANAIGMKVEIDTPDGREGTITVSFKSLDQLDDVIKRLSQTPTNRLMS